jgi:N-acetylmuramoyl-L-alanine amidase
MDKIEYIVIHTAAHGNIDNNYDTTAKQINDWHIANGWSGIGYHFVIRFDGIVEFGRPISKSGAHAKGLNEKSIGICMSGNGDFHDFTIAQYQSLIKLCLDLMKTYNINVENVIGHRELNLLIKKGLLAKEFKTSKSCPGNKINMEDVRDLIFEKRKLLKEEHIKPITKKEEAKQQLDKALGK